MGFTVSPVVSCKIAQSLSAGWVQSVVVRLIVIREREIQQFADRFSVPIMATVQTAQSEQLLARRTAEPFAALDQA